MKTSSTIALNAGELPMLWISVQSLALRLTEWLGTEGLTAEFVEALQFDDENGRVVLDNLRAPWRLNHIRLLLREIGVFFA
jgi:hypothetical protein